ncbi:unnamed protein product [Closterium sp. NIES-53]
MASLRVLVFDHEGSPLQFDTRLDDLQLYQLSDSRDIILLFDHTSGAAPAPADTAVSATRSQWLTRDAAARLAICNHLPLAECANFGQHKTVQTLYDAVVTRYSSPATSSLGRLLLPYLFPELSAFATVEDLVSHLRASDSRYRAALPAEFLDRNPPPMYITHCFIVTRLPDSLRSVRDHFLSLDPTSLTVELLEQHLLAAETSAVAVGAARGTPRTPFFEGCSPSPLAPSYASAAAVGIFSTEDVGAASASAKHRSSKGKGGRGGGWGSGSGGGGSSGGSGGSGGGGSGGSDGGSGGSGSVGGGSGGSGGSGGAGSGGAWGVWSWRPYGAARTGGVGGAGAGDPTEPGAGGSGAGGAGAGGAGARDTSAGGVRAGGAGVGGPGAGSARARGAGAVDPGAGGAGLVDPVSGGTGARGTVRLRPYFDPLLQQVHGVPSSPSLSPPLMCPLPDQSQPPLQPASPLPVPSPYTEQSGGLTERREPASRPTLPVRTARRVRRSRPPLVPGTHAMALRPSSIPRRVPLPAPLSPLFLRYLALSLTTLSAAASALVAELLDFAAACRLDYATALVAESESAIPPSVGGECALGTDVLDNRQEDLEYVPTPCSYAEAITGPNSSQWQAAMDAEMASWKSTGTYVDEVPPPRANIVDGMWIFRVKQPPGSPPAFKARYVARGFRQRQGRDYELHSLDFSVAFVQGSLHEEIKLRRPPGFTESFPASTLWSLRRPVYGLRQSPREWYDTLRTTLAALVFAPSTADPSLFLRTDTSLPPFYVIVYVDNLVFATTDTEALTLVKSELHKRHTCTNLGPSALRLPVLLATAHSSVYWPLALTSTFGRVRRAEWSVPRACGLPHVPDDVHTT